jgi:hypothetical protein
MDPVQRLLEYRYKMSKTKLSEETDFAGKALPCYQRWKAGKRFPKKGTPSYPVAVDLEDFLKPVRLAA